VEWVALLLLAGYLILPIKASPHEDHRLSRFQREIRRGWSGNKPRVDQGGDQLLQVISARSSLSLCTRSSNFKGCDSLQRCN